MHKLVSSEDGFLFFKISTTGVRELPAPSGREFPVSLGYFVMLSDICPYFTFSEADEHACLLTNR